MTWTLWNAVLTQGIVTAVVGGLLLLVVWVRAGLAVGSVRSDRVLLGAGLVLVLIGAATGIVAAYLAIGVAA